MSLSKGEIILLSVAGVAMVGGGVYLFTRKAAGVSVPAPYMQAGPSLPLTGLPRPSSSSANVGIVPKPQPPPDPVGGIISTVGNVATTVNNAIQQALPVINQVGGFLGNLFSFGK